MSALAARRLYIVAYCTIAAALAWLIVSVAVSGELEQSDPALALRWRAHDPAALIELAQRGLDAQKPADVRSYALEAIAHSPHDATAWRLLGQAALGSNEALAAQIFAEAGSLTHRDATLAAWFFENAVRAHRYAEAVRYADVIIRRAPEKQSAMVFRLAALAQDPAATPALASALQRGPDWRGPFFRELASNSANGAATERLVNAMTAAGAALKPAELSGLLTQMVRDGRPQEAYRLWLAALPARRRPTGPVYDPNFSGAPAAAPFGWTLNARARDEIRFAEGGGLQIDFQGRKGQRIAAQTLLLPPGRYHFATAGRLLTGDEELVNWNLGCGQPAVLLDLVRGAPTTASADFEVPADCPTQTLTLSGLSRGSGAASAIIERVDIQRIG